MTLTFPIVDRPPVMTAGRRRRIVRCRYSGMTRRDIPPPARTGVVARARAPTNSAPTALALRWPRVSDQQFGILVELDAFNHRLLDAQHTPP